MSRYPIKREFFPYNLFTPPISKGFVRMAQKGMKTPGFIYKDPDILTRMQRIPAYQNGRSATLCMMTESVMPVS